MISAIAAPVPQASLPKKAAQKASASGPNSVSQYGQDYFQAGCSTQPANPRFGGRVEVEKAKHPEIASGELITETAFFREPATLEAMKSCLQKRSGPIEIADYACSSGEETYSIAMLLGDLEGQGVHITGYDLAEQALANARSGKFPITQLTGKLLFQSVLSGAAAYKDFYLGFPRENAFRLETLEQEAGYRKLFNHYFEQEGDEQRLGKYEVLKNYVVTPQLAEQCDFQKGDILEIDQTLKPESMDAVMFRNALYHLITQPKVTQSLKDADSTSSESESESETEQREAKPLEESRHLLLSLFGKIHQVLKDDGILVLGANENQQHHQGELVAECLKAAGFLPVFSEKQQVTIWEKSPLPEREAQGEEIPSLNSRS